MLASRLRCPPRQVLALASVLSLSLRPRVHLACASTVAEGYAAGEIIDEADALKSNAFAIAPEDLVAETKRIVVELELGIKDPSVLAEDFSFNFPVVGPLSKEEYVTSVSGFDLKGALPDWKPRFHNFFVDPLETNRVWFMSRAVGTHTGKGGFPFKPSNKTVEAPPQLSSLRFNEDMKVIEFTGGYVVDKNVGNCGGLGGVFGIFYAVGHPLPFPEGRPYTRSVRFRLFNWVGQMAQKFAKKKEAGTAAAERAEEPEPKKEE